MGMFENLFGKGKMAKVNVTGIVAFVIAREGSTIRAKFPDVSEEEYGRLCAMVQIIAVTIAVNLKVFGAHGMIQRVDVKKFLKNCGCPDDSIDQIMEVVNGTADAADCLFEPVNEDGDTAYDAFSKAMEQMKESQKKDD